MLDVGEGDTQETPFLDIGVEDTQERPMLDLGADDTQETSYLDVDSELEQTADTVETPIPVSERTAELDLDDLGLDVSLDDSFIGRLPDDFSRDGGETSVMDPGATAVMDKKTLGDDEATMIARPDDTAELAALADALEDADRDEGVDFDLGGDLDATSSASELDDLLGATVEMTS
jgi:hypothetical protein